jgi:hypothetical protein
MSRFVITDPSNQTQVFEISGSTVSIGRADSNDLLLPQFKADSHTDSQTAFPVDLWDILGKNKPSKGYYHLEAQGRNIRPNSFAATPIRCGWKSAMSSLGDREHLYAWRTELRRNRALYPVCELRKREPRERANLRAMRKAAGTADRSSLRPKCSSGAANGVPEMSQDISGRRQVLRFLWPAARARSRRNRSPAVAAGSRASVRRSGGAPKDRFASFARERLSALRCPGSIVIGITATCLFGRRGFSAEPACGAFPAAGDQPSGSTTSPAGSSPLRSKSGFHDASFPAGRSLAV